MFDKSIDRHILVAERICECKVKNENLMMGYRTLEAKTTYRSNLKRDIKELSLHDSHEKILLHHIL